MRPRIPSVCLGNLQLAADFDVGIDLARIFQRDLQDGSSTCSGVSTIGLHRKGADLAGFLVEFGAQVFLRLVVLARGDNNGVFHRADYNLRINALFPAERVDRVVELTCHKYSVIKSASDVRTAGFRE